MITIDYTYYLHFPKCPQSSSGNVPLLSTVLFLSWNDINYVYGCDGRIYCFCKSYYIIEYFLTIISYRVKHILVLNIQVNYIFKYMTMR